MEVHHHPQLRHEPKPWKEYLLEGLMIFLAVTMGFFAESLRERLSNAMKEKEFIRSMIVDLRTDTAKLGNVIAWYSKLEIQQDTLLEYLPSLKNGFDGVFDRNLTSIMWFPDFIYTDNTIQQLRGTDGMRLIKNGKTVNGILEYNAMVQITLKNETGLTALLDKMDMFRANLFNYRALDAEYKKGKTSGEIENEKFDILLSHDEKDIDRFYNEIKNYSNACKGIKHNMIETRTKAIRLINLLKEEYHFKNE